MNLLNSRYLNEADRRQHYDHILRRWRMGDHLTGRWEGLNYYLDLMNQLPLQANLRPYDAHFRALLARFEELTAVDNCRRTYTYKGGNHA